MKHGELWRIVLYTGITVAILPAFMVTELDSVPIISPQEMKSGAKCTCSAFSSRYIDIQAHSEISMHMRGTILYSMLLLKMNLKNFHKVITMSH